MCTCSTSIKLLLNCTGTHNILSDTLLCDQINPKLDNFYKINVNHDSKRTKPTQQNTAIPGQCTHTSSLTQPNNRHTSQTIMIRWISNCSIFIKIDVKIYNSCLHIVDKYSDCWCIDLWQRHNLGSFDTLEGGRPELCLLVVVRTRSFFFETGPKIKVSAPE